MLFAARLAAVAAPLLDRGDAAPHPDRSLTT